MATIGLDKLFYARITEDEDGHETYATPVQMAKAMSADLSVEMAEATLYADDGAAEIVKEFKSGTPSSISGHAILVPKLVTGMMAALSLMGP